MAIVNFTHTESQVPAGAMNVRKCTQFGPEPVWLWDTHTGLCLANREANGYHDSDFYMMVWDPETQSPREICFASTRGWTYPSYGSRPDATPEVVAAYDAYVARQRAAARASERKAMAASRGALRKTALSEARKHGFPHWRLLRLRRTIPVNFELVMGLFSPRLRSKFKLSLQAQLLKWLRDETPAYRTPFSPKQLEALNRK